ncbi:hypothetical protein BKA61DRAFT_191660 [Leptodontidium sp. MPI-SDFR-AT-0119]|nr:hypothetical protein BKA61DRAFT_191660 [Leptodontidium sp. MPI-SDFR-AT-0119]
MKYCERTLITGSYCTVYCMRCEGSRKYCLLGHFVSPIISQDVVRQTGAARSDVGQKWRRWSCAHIIVKLDNAKPILQATVPILLLNFTPSYGGLVSRCALMRSSSQTTTFLDCTRNAFQPEAGASVTSAHVHAAPLMSFRSSLVAFLPHEQQTFANLHHNSRFASQILDRLKNIQILHC